MFVHIYRYMYSENVVPNSLMNLYQLKYMFQMGVPYLTNPCNENQKLYTSH